MAMVKMEEKKKHTNWTKGVTERINRLRNRYWENKPEVDIERAQVYTEVYKQTEAEDVIIRRSKALLEYVSRKSIVINDDELVVGTEGRKSRSAVFCPDICWRWMDEELDTMQTRKQDPYIISEEQKKVLREEIFPYWDGRSMEDYYLAHLTEEQKNVAIGTDIVNGDSKSQAGPGEFGVGYSNIILKKGFRGVQSEAEEALGRLDAYDPQNFDKMNFYKAVIMSCEAARVLASRYAAKAREMAGEEMDENRKKELLAIAGRCERVPYDPPRTFHEAVQAVWLTQILLWAEENTQSNCIDRPDQYLYPFYQREVEAGTLCEADALELLECLWIKMAEVVYCVSAEFADYTSGYQSFHGMTLGGTDADGNDAVNPLSYIMIQATMDLQMHIPTINVRVSKKTPDAFLGKVCDLVKLGTGQPAIFFDETAVPLLQKRGIPERDARGWCACGCVEPGIPGKSNMWAEGARYSYATAVEWVLFNGYSKIHGRQIGLKTGDPCSFQQFDEFKAAVKQQLAYLIKIAVSGSQLAERAHMLRMPEPVRSCCLEGCVEKGVDAMSGGALYNNGPGIETTGVADLADSLMVIKKLVYDEHALRMEQLVEILDQNFEGYENYRQMFINEVPKYGNDIDEVDLLAAEFVDYSCEETRRYKSLNGQPYNNCVVPVIANIPHGQATWALPSGRKAGEPLADGISPFPSYDKQGPTAVIKSVCKVDHTNNGGGALLNMRLSPNIMQSERDKANFIALLRSEEDLGGYHVQFNVVKSETLREAQVKPEDHGDLLVRVAGYSAYFVELRKDAQQAIIDRTENVAW